jgi:hypothetical protein
MTQQFLGFAAAKKREEMAAVAVVKDLVVEREAVRAEEEVGLGKVCVAGGVGIGWRRGFLWVLKRWVLVAGFLKGRDNRLLLLGFLNGNESFCIPSEHFPHTPFLLFSSATFRVEQRERVRKREREGFWKKMGGLRVLDASLFW